MQSASKSWKSRLVLPLLAALASAALGGCVESSKGGDQGGGTGASAGTGPAPVVDARAIVVTPPVASLPLGTSQLLVATATLADGTTRDVTKDVSWSSKNPAVVAVDDGAAKGKLTAVGPGTAAVVAKLGELLAESTVTITDTAKLASVVLSPGNALPVVVAGLTLELGAVGNYTDATSHALAADVVWESSDPAVATVEAGLVKGLASGAVTISGTFAGVTGAIELTVTPGILSISPASGEGNVAVTDAISIVFSDDVDPATLTAETLDFAYQTLDSASGSQNPGPAMAAPAAESFALDGDLTYDAATRTVRFRPLGGRFPGHARIVMTASSGILTALGVAFAGLPPTYAFTTVAAIDNVFITLAVNDRPDYVGKPGEVVALALVGIDSNGDTVDLTDTAIWASSDGEVATVSNLADPRGALTLKAAGVTTITVMFETFTQTVDFLVDGTAPAPGGADATPATTLATSSITGTSMAFRFDMAEDDKAFTENLRYGVYISKTVTIATPADLESDAVTYVDDAAIIYKDGATEIMGAMAGLEPSTLYHLNVLVIDDAGNEALYTEVTFTTTATADATAPVVADKALVVSDQSAVDGSFKLTWGVADDDLTLDPDVFYIVYYSYADDIDTAEKAAQNGSILLFTYDQLSETFEFLPEAGDTIYLNVLAYDVQGNATVYTTTMLTGT